MQNGTVFCEVTARISPNFVKTQTQSFDFDEYLQDICRQLDITVILNAYCDYTLQGQWIPISKINNMLTKNWNMNSERTPEELSESVREESAVKRSDDKGEHQVSCLPAVNMELLSTKHKTNTPPVGEETPQIGDVLSKECCKRHLHEENINENKLQRECKTCNIKQFHRDNRSDSQVHHKCNTENELQEESVNKDSDFTQIRLKSGNMDENNFIETEHQDDKDSGTNQRLSADIIATERMVCPSNKTVSREITASAFENTIQTIKQEMDIEVDEDAHEECHGNHSIDRKNGCKRTTFGCHGDTTRGDYDISNKIMTRDCHGDTTTPMNSLASQIKMEEAQNTEESWEGKKQSKSKDRQEVRMYVVHAEGNTVSEIKEKYADNNKSLMGSELDSELEDMVDDDDDNDDEDGTTLAQDDMDWNVNDTSTESDGSDETTSDESMKSDDSEMKAEDKSGPKMDSEGIDIKCSECDYVTDKKSLLKVHVTCKHMKEGTKCDVCRKDFSCVRYMKKHRRLHFNKNVCNICGRKLRSSVKLKEHLKTHEVFCPVCNEIFLKRKVLREHIRGDHPEFDLEHFEIESEEEEVMIESDSSNGTKKITKIRIKLKQFKCSECDYVTNTKKYLTEHSRVKHMLKETKCDLCDKIFTCERYMQKHRRLHFNQNFCTLCEKKFRSTVKLQQHMKCHEILCPVCNESFLKQDIFNIHMKEEHPNFHSEVRPRDSDNALENFVCENLTNLDPALIKSKYPVIKTGDVDQQFGCAMCKFKSNKRKSVAYHYRIIHGGTPTSCNVCGKVFKNDRYMKKHRILHYSALHLCDICGKSFKSPKILKKHRVVHEDGYKAQEYSCQYCDKKYVSKYSVDNHVRVEHLGEARKGGLCSICGKDFVSKSRLAEHFNTHTGIKPYTCEVCNKSFIYASCLRSHKWTHENKEYPCDQCDKVFKLYRSMIKHKKAKHSSDHKSYICHTCGKNFAEKGTLKRHELIHSGSKPFCCKLCGQSFNQGSIIRRHLSIIHKLDKPKQTWKEDVYLIPEKTFDTDFDAAENYS